MTIDFKAQANAMRDELIARRRDFHQHPETAFEEVRTAGIVAEELNKLGLEVQTGVGKTGVIGILEGDSDGPTVLVRADMDALPMQEVNDVEYASTVEGKMHACGHDGHTTIALGVAKLFSQHRDKLNGRIKFVFQPAEEIGGGARAMIAEGALDNPKPDVSLGLHLWNTMPLGQIGVAEGPIMAEPSAFELTIQGKGGHGAAPDDTVDPVVCAAQMVMAFQTIVSRNREPLDALAFSVTQIITGTAKNIIPDTAYVSGTFRTFSHETTKMVNKRLTEIAENTAAAMGCTVDIDIRNAEMFVSNHPDVVKVVRHALEKLGTAEEDLIEERTTLSEDVGLFMTDVPGMFLFVGSANDEKGLNYPHHHPKFDFDEEVLPHSVAVMSAAIAEYLIEA